MKHLILLIVFIVISGSSFSQKTEVLLDKEGNLTFETKYETKNDIVNQLQNWFASFSKNITGKTTYINSLSGELKYEASMPIFLSKKPSVYQTNMHFTIHVYKNGNHHIIKLNNIYYTSIPEYGKQGTPSVTTYPSDWFSANRFYKKSGKTRWLNQIVKQNTITKSEKLLASAKEYF